MAPDPAGIERILQPPPVEPRWPSRFWLPVAMLPGPDGPLVDWAHFGGAPLSEPFFADSARKATARPFNRIFRYATPLSVFIAGAGTEATVPPSGFIFHMSRCGSTLVSQMLAALPGSLMVSEAPPLDTAVQVAAHGRDLAPLKAMVAALTRPRAGERHVFVKLDMWHSAALPLFRQAFPSVPWIFLFRDPAEVIVSQLRRRGPQTTPALAPLLGLALDPAAPAEQQIALVLERVCEAALAAQAGGGGLILDHARLPAATASAILPHFGIAADPAGLAAMAAVAERDAKAPCMPFAPDREAKRKEATPAVLAAAERLAPLYRRLCDSEPGP